MLGRRMSETTKQKLRESALRQWREQRSEPIQTFLPYPDFHASARVLDPKRLGKQRVEARQILSALTGETSGWRNHPATKMWRGYEAALAKYSDVCIKEWRRRGYRNTMLLLKPRVYVLPPWFGDPAFHASHRSNLLRKDALYYSLNGWTEGTDLEYVWPVA